MDSRCSLILYQHVHTCLAHVRKETVPIEIRLIMIFKRRRLNQRVVSFFIIKLFKIIFFLLLIKVDQLDCSKLLFMLRCISFIYLLQTASGKDISVIINVYHCLEQVYIVDKFCYHIYKLSFISFDRFNPKNEKKMMNDCGWENK